MIKRPESTTLATSVACCLALIVYAHTSILGQTTRTIRDDRNVVACIVAPPTTRTATTLNDDRVRVDLRAPATPPASIVAKLPSAQRDFSPLPIDVFLVPSAASPDAEMRTPRRVQPLTIDPTLVRPTIDGRTSTDLFVRVTYPRDVLQAGVDIVAQRTATATNGEQIVSQTRCRITEADAAEWR